MSMIVGLLLGILFGLIHSAWSMLIGAPIVYGLICATYALFRTRRHLKSPSGVLLAAQADCEREEEKLLRNTEGMIQNAWQFLAVRCDQSDPSLGELRDLTIPAGTTARDDITSLVELREAAHSTAQLLETITPPEPQGAEHLLVGLGHNLRLSVIGIDSLIAARKPTADAQDDVQVDPADPDYAIKQTDVDMRRKDLGPLGAAQVFTFEFVISAGSCLIATLATYGIKSVLL